MLQRQLCLVTPAYRYEVLPSIDSAESSSSSLSSELAAEVAAAGGPRLPPNPPPTNCVAGRVDVQDEPGTDHEDDGCDHVVVARSLHKSERQAAPQLNLLDDRNGVARRWHRGGAHARRRHADDARAGIDTVRQVSACNRRCGAQRS